MIHIITPRLTAEYSQAICIHNGVVRDMCEHWTPENLERFRVSSENVCRLRAMQEQCS